MCAMQSGKCSLSTDRRHVKLLGREELVQAQGEIEAGASRALLLVFFAFCVSCDVRAPMSSRCGGANPQKGYRRCRELGSDRCATLAPAGKLPG